MTSAERVYGVDALLCSAVTSAFHCETFSENPATSQQVRPAHHRATRVSTGLDVRDGSACGYITPLSIGYRSDYSFAAIYGLLNEENGGKEGKSNQKREIGESRIAEKGRTAGLDSPPLTLKKTHAVDS